MIVFHPDRWIFQRKGSFQIPTKKNFDFVGIRDITDAVLVYHLPNYHRE